MRIGALILARLDSSRLPGKALADVAGRPLIDYVRERAMAVTGLDAVVLATSDRAVDEPLEAFAKTNGLLVYRGDVADVAGRCLAAAEAHGLDAFVRVNGDSPFLDLDLVATAIARMRAPDGPDFVTNLRPRSYPYGVSVEVVRTAIYRQLYVRFTTSDEREHVTKGIYDRLNDLRWENVVNPAGDETGLHATVDTPDDLDRFRAFASSWTRPWISATYHNFAGSGY